MERKMYVSDTMAFILRLERRKLPSKVKIIFEQAENGQNDIMVPAMVLAELAYLSEAKRIDTNLKEAREYLEKYSRIKQTPISLACIISAFEIDDIPELHDRIIAGTGKLFQAI